MKKKISPEEQREKMLNTPIPRLIVTLSLPAVLNQLITVIYNTADTYFVSQLNTSASAAVGIVFSLQSLIQAIGFGVAMGAGSLVSLKMGEDKYDEAVKYASGGTVMSAGLGTVIGVTGLLTLTPLMKLLGATETILPYAADYARYILIASPVMCLTFVLAAILRNEGQSLLSTIGTCSGGLINIILDPILIFKCGLGTAGAAIATGISQFVSLLILVGMFLSGKSAVKIRLRSIPRNFRDYGKIFMTGIPTVFRQGLACIASATLNRSAAVYTDAAVAAITIANKVYLLVRGIMIGVGQGFMPVAGYNYGAKNGKRTKSAFRFTVFMGTAVACVAAVVTAIFPGEIIGLFRDDPSVVEIGRPALMFACAVMPFMAYSTFVNQLYQCLGFKLRATLLASCRQGIFFLPLIWILPRLLGLTGIQATQPAADFLTFLISIPFGVYFIHKKLSQLATL